MSGTELKGLCMALEILMFGMRHLLTKEFKVLGSRPKIYTQPDIENLVV